MDKNIIHNTECSKNQKVGAFNLYIEFESRAKLSNIFEHEDSISENMYIIFILFFLSENGQKNILGEKNNGGERRRCCSVS